MNFLCFSSSKNVLISPSFLKDTFAGYRIWDFELFSVLEKRYADASWVSDEKSTITETVFPIVEVSLLFHYFQDLSFVFSVQKSYCDVSYRFLWV